LPRPPSWGALIQNKTTKLGSWSQRRHITLEWFRKLLDDRLGALQEELTIRLAGSPSEALAWFELQAKQISSMAAFWDDHGHTAERLDELRRGLTRWHAERRRPKAPESN